MNKYSVTPTFNYDDNDMVDIISSAVYDIGYWAGIHDSNDYYEARDELPKGVCYEDILFQMLKRGSEIIMYDVEDEDETWSLTLEKLLNGIKLAIQNGFWNGKLDDIDGEVGDIIFQYALFEEIVYG